MANKQKPDNVHRLNGTYRPDRHGDNDTKPEWNEDLPDMPGCLCEVAQAEWRRIMSIAPAGVLTQTDRTLMTQYCALWAELEKDPAGFPSGKHSQLKLVQQELGFTPISRGKIGGAPKQKNDDGPRTIPR